MRTLFKVVFASLLLTAGFAVQDPQIRVDVEAVNVLVTVTDAKGRFVTDLSKERFIVYEDGKEQEITNFSRQTDLPLLMGILIDTSSSVRLHLKDEVDAARQFIRSVMRPGDQALLVEFDHGTSLLRDFTGKPGVLVRELNQLRAGGGTALLDAIYTVSQEKMMDADRRKALILLSDGQDLNSKVSLEDALEMAHTAHLAIYAIGTSRFSASPEKRGEELLTTLAEETGGRAFFPYSVERLESSFDLINQELRSQYNIAYVPEIRPADGQFRKIEVKVRDDKGLTIRHRHGYYAASPETAMNR